MYYTLKGDSIVMDITLEKIDIIRDRTGVSYKEANDALNAANGNVVDALINIEETSNKKWTETISVKGTEAIDKVKNVVKSGNVNRIKVKKDDYTILDIPVTAGALSAMIIPEVTAVGAALALVSRCTIEVERPNKDTININNVISDKADFIASKMKQATGLGNCPNQNTQYGQTTDPLTNAEQATDNLKCGMHDEEADGEIHIPEQTNTSNYTTTGTVSTNPTNLDDPFRQ